MPLVAIQQPTRDELEDLSGRRWDSLRLARPDLAPAVELQQRLLAIVGRAAQALGTGRLPRLSLPPKYLAAKLGRGVPIFAGEPIPVPVGLLKTSLLNLCDALAAGGAGESADHIKEAIVANTMDAASLLTASLSRDQQAIRTGAVHRGLAPDLVWLLAELAASPFAHVLQVALLSPHDLAGDALGDAMRAWNHGYCAVCGSWPALAEVAEGHRVLRCSFCAAGWELNEYCCIYCREHGEAFVTAAPDEERKDRRVEICGTCQGYLKTIDVAGISPFPLVAITDMESMDLDLAAMEHGYTRPPMREFARR
jgi:FdhE protein